ncbi:hypothetical protein [uncultured Tateyamaria sp.]|uniref:hypothetical protein n=1 Tax=uncultured Tateyamaria sp. TaxID=455651 RepID=UPI002615DC3E|nr:hypothetical protein [uncultured Tateyamaria sp.]
MPVDFIAQYLPIKTDADNGFDPMVDELAALIWGDAAKQKVGVIFSIISDFYVGRVSIGAKALSQDESQPLRTLISAALHAVLSPGNDRTSG